MSVYRSIVIRFIYISLKYGDFFCGDFVGTQPIRFDDIKNLPQYCLGLAKV